MILALLLGACATDLGTLGVLADEYANRTIEASTPGLQTALGLGALSAWICTDLAPAGWDGVVIAEPLPLSKGLTAVLGQPLVERFSDAGSVIELNVSPVEINGVEPARVQLVFTDGSETSEPLQVSGNILVAETNVPLGTINYELGTDCEDVRTRLYGTATWASEEGSYSYALPTADGDETAMIWPGVAGWLPGAGSVKWTGTVDGQERTLTTDDASQMTAQAGGGLWGADISGGSNDRQAAWTARSELSLVP